MHWLSRLVGRLDMLVTVAQNSDCDFGGLFETFNANHSMSPEIHMGDNDQIRFTFGLWRGRVQPNENVDPKRQDIELQLEFEPIEDSDNRTFNLTLAAAVVASVIFLPEWALGPICFAAILTVFAPELIRNWQINKGNEGAEILMSLHFSPKCTRPNLIAPYFHNQQSVENESSCAPVQLPLHEDHNLRSSYVERI